jgi:hypothetical protein
MLKIVFQVLTVLYLLAVVVLTGCRATAEFKGESVDNTRAPNVQAATMEPSMRVAKVTHHSSTWLLERKSAGRGIKVKSVQFLTENEGWVLANSNEIYKTVDSGKQWIEIGKSPVDAGLVREFRFVSLKDGWIVAQRSGSSYRYSNEDRTEVYKTSNSGRSWELSFAGEALILDDAMFTPTTGWVIGRKFIGSEPLRFEPGIFKSGSEHWRDLSDKFTTEARGSGNKSPALPTNLTVVEPCIIILENTGEFFQSCSDNKFEALGAYREIDSQLSTQQLGSYRELLWVLDATGGVEGTASRLAMIEINATKNRASFVSFGDVYARHFKHVSEGHFLLFGDRRYEKVAKDKVIDVHQSGIVLLTSDFQTWNEIARLQNDRFFISVTEAGESTVWAADNVGQLYKLQAR